MNLFKIYIFDLLAIFFALILEIFAIMKGQGEIIFLFIMWSFFGYLLLIGIIQRFKNLSNV